MKMAPAPTSASALASHHHHHHHSNPPHQQFQVTEDTPVDYLEGCMEVLVIFPNEKSIPMSIQRRMPMLDLLIHVTAANKLSPAAHLLQVTDEEGRVLPQKPSTPIGSLNAHKVYIVPKNRLAGAKPDRFARPSYQAKTVTHFEPTFRVQVRLPRNQLFVTRVTARTQLADLLHTVCSEKDLEPSHYEFRHPVNQDERLRLSGTLDEYKITEVVLVHVPIVESASPRRHERHSGPSPVPSPRDQLTVHDLPAMSNKSKTPANYTSSAMPGSTSQSRAKTGLRPTASEAALNHAGEKKKRGLLGLLGFGKHKKGSSMGDSSVSSDSVGDRSISPTRSDEPAPEPPAPAAPRPPSPVLVSKRLAEEAVAKRNSRLLMNQKSAEAAALGIATPEEPAKPSTANGSAKAPARAGGKKRMAPAPPVSAAPVVASSAQVNGIAKAESEVSTYTTCSSGSSGVSPPVSVIDNASIRDATPSPNPSQKRPLSTPNYTTPVSHEGSPVRGQSSGNLLSTPRVSATNLTAVSSTSDASLSSAVKKRKAPAPPPLVRESQAEAKTPEARETNGHADSDATSGVSDESVSDVSAPSSKRSPSPEEDAKQPVSRRVSSTSTPEVASLRSNSPSEAPEKPNGTHSDDDYDVVKPHNQNANQTDEEPHVEEPHVEEHRLNKAEPVEERVEPEAIYSMVVKKSTQSVKVVNLHEETCDSPKEIIEEVDSAPSEVLESAEKVVSDVIQVDEEPEVERSPDERAESPVLWEYKLPAPPTPFADNGEALPLAEKLSIKSDSDRSRSSSISVDSLQEVTVELDDPIPSQTVQQVTTTAIIETVQTEDKVTLDNGDQLMGESSVDEPAVKEQSEENEAVETTQTERIPSPLKEEEPTAEEIVSDESLPSIIPPLPITSPPELMAEEEIMIADPIEPPPIFQEEKQETVRTRSNSHSSNSSSASLHSETNSLPATSDGGTNEAKSPSPEPVVKKEPDAIVNQPTAQVTGNGGVNAAPAFLPLMNVDLMQQFQAALTTISDPQARALQEEFLRLQQQFLTWQLHAAGVQLQQSTLAQPVVAMPSVEQTVHSASQSPVLAEHKHEEPPVAQSPLVEEEQPVERSRIEFSRVVEVTAQMEAPVEKEKSSDESSSQTETLIDKKKSSDESSSQLEATVENDKLTEESSSQTEAPVIKEKSSDESSEESEEPIYRYAGPPQVTLDTWKPGRPRSEVIDYSSTPSFNIPTFNANVEPKSKVESKISTFSMGPASQSPGRPSSASPTVTAAPSAPVTAPKIPVANKADSERKDVKSPSPEAIDSHPEIAVSQQKEVKAKKEDMVKPEPKKEEKPAIREAAKEENDDADVSSGVRDKVGKFESNIDKSVVLRKSSFVTARPFEPRPVSMPIKRPTFAPAVIQPVPFVSRKIQWAPEVRGFASLPSPEHAAAKTIASGEPGPAPFGTKPRPVSIVNKENQTVVIRNKLLESARRPSAELETPPIQLEANEEQRDSRSTVEQVEEKRPTPAPRPVTMPASSSLILAASAESSPKKEASIPPPPPPATSSAPATPAKRSMPSRFERKPDPREELLSSIRNFGANGGALRKVSH